mmetsp:Transcript_52206/g.59654  ORF Transcript_52206/g.59654 Transcript_52206/m.59654 type:complete len:478 (-) Transcript_52206:128-1561(-)
MPKTLGDTRSEVSLIEEASGGKVGVTASALILLNSIVGAGTLALPLAMKIYGLPFTAVLLAFVTWLGTMSVIILLSVAEATGASSFFEFGRLAYGNFGKIGVHFVIIFNNLGYLLAYLIILGSDVPPLLSYIFGMDMPRALMLITAGLLFFPMVIKKKMDGLKLISIVSFIFLGFFCVIVIFKGISKLVSTSQLIPHETLPPEGGVSLITGLPALFLAFSFQFNFFPVIHSMEMPTPERIKRMVNIALAAASTVYLLVGFFGYVLFAKDTSVNLLSDFTSSEGLNFSVISLQLAILMVICMSYPVAFFEYRSNFISLSSYLPWFEQGNEEQTFEEERTTDDSDEEIETLLPQTPSVRPQMKSLESEEFFQNTTIMLHAIAVGLALMIPNLRVVFNIVGALGSNLLGFILPSIFYHKLVPATQRTTQNDLIAKFLLVFGVVSAVVCVTLEFMAVGHEVVDVEEPGLPLDTAPISTDLH